jgi:hypothetical protein
MRLAAILLIAVSLAPLAALARWTFALKPGAGPQGGEALFVGWFLLAGWLTLVTVASSVRVVSPLNRTVTRYLLTMAGGFGIAVATSIVAFVLLNSASLVETPPLRARLDVWGAFALFAALIAADLRAWVR